MFSFIVRHALYRLLTGNFKDLSDQLGMDRNSLKLDVKKLSNTMEEMQHAAESVMQNSTSIGSVSTLQSNSDLTATKSKSKSADLVSTIGSLDFTPNEVRLFKFYKFLLSAKFRVLTYLICFVIHISLWLILGLIQLTNPESASPYYNTGINNFFGACTMHSGTVAVFCGLFASYLAALVVLLLISFFLEKDTWGIKIETSVMSILLLIAVINYLVCPYITIIRTYTDYFFPYGQSMVMYSIIQLFVFVTIPLCRSIKGDGIFPEEIASTMFERILLNKETFKIALDFSRRSYCSEPVLCFDNIENYKKARRKSNKLKIALHILNTHLKKGAPLELNIDKIEERFKSLQENISNQDEKKIDEEVGLLRIHCLQDMSEMMYRLILSDKVVKEVAMMNSGKIPVDSLNSPVSSELSNV
ncbi:predicted protein [Naegleria gruberi]|uniref:Predicted protein n=1 Tax=Naegleria gruberi TaxID=5762 RepID=D2VA99_NAEGR|nr:uncharacterized protein NAEGRDRAFT_65785 [Naegleria gruberi]EFC46270.1 predicted protein [Naegleria gruberi]|eukprot:XP_002679014.1 predicted protein [Naegleria gruberi strain NEG-M]